MPLHFAHPAATCSAPSQQNQERTARVQAAKKRVTQVVGPWLAIGWLAEAAWQFAFVRNTPSSLVASALILLAAVAAFQIALARVHVVTPYFQAAPAWARRLLVFSVSVNAAWLSVAAALGVLIAVRATTDVPLVPIALVLAVVLALAGAYQTYSRRDPYYAAAMCWAFVGVYSEQVGAHPAVAGVLTGAILANAAALVLVVTGMRAPQPGAAAQEVRQALVEDEG